MANLLDVNVLIALFDPSHIHHDAAHAWFAEHAADGWATCPLTENGFVRVLANPAYPGRATTVADAVDRLRRFTASNEHVFWPDSVSLLDPASVEPSQLSGHREVTDAYLLALAVRHDGALVTFDRSVRVTAAVAASSDTVVMLP